MFGDGSNASKHWDWTEFLRQLDTSNWLHHPIWVLLSVVVSGLAIKAATAVFNAYVMRVWNGYVHPDEVAAAKAAVKKIEAKVEAERLELEAFRSEVNMLLSANDRMCQEIISLRIENDRLRLELINTKTGNETRKYNAEIELT